ncbi:DesA family fatty acid desaturase [Pseudomarimonas salicorniae]|uniref:Fatty acid desaturase n=1 Tax=Pseudomarimonas salicorniae TaxID=2933270 RepID=A0ABT0GGC7_9GAMM|nr:fatty acid desaturase [Lysobacter sp. CAU 1642]MCK7593590.1 fatty acid desaturase [Lysobacter sp. CAU 1642]
MNDTLYQWLTQGLVGSDLTTLLITFAVMAQATIFSVTLYLHRCQAHRGVDLHPVVSHPMRLWLWLSTAMVTKEWVAIHRKHHAKCETDEDPHSPQVFGIGKVVFQGVQLYQIASDDKAIMEKYGAGTPTDWLERHLYGARPSLGPTLLLFAEVAAFGVIGITFWALQMLVIPVLAAGVVNGLGHWWGYRNFETDDRATNLTPWGLVIGGEELHNNHHAFPSSARFALRRFEFDIGWAALRLFERLGLAKVRRVAPQLDIRPNIHLPDSDTLRAIMVHRYKVMTDYFSAVTLPTLREEAQAAGESLKSLPRKLRRSLANGGRWLDHEGREHLAQWIAERPRLADVYEYRARLRAVYERSGQGAEAMLESLRQWCAEAEASGNRALQQFAARLKGYALVPAPQAA